MNLYKRISNTLGWSLEKTMSYSLEDLHSAVMLISTILADDIVDAMIARKRPHKTAYVW